MLGAHHTDFDDQFLLGGLSPNRTVVQLPEIFAARPDARGMSLRDGCGGLAENLCGAPD
ncbi:hypothetical protein THTE_3045 [Thermogutta terrifontis]|uniref:Uncharacterized protein n=1 Tax=Thermogutta terrifontis TaxID=1331910 RepID=A0A286RI67_9BACT|nr:hypothetical protein THTE_3045 [Thermogutta terrifontis]